MGWTRIQIRVQAIRARFLCIYRQDDLASLVGFSRQHLMCQTRVSQRQHLADVGLELTRIEQRSHPTQTSRGDSDEKEHALNALSSRLFLIRHGDRGHENSSRFENFEGAVQCLAADRIDHDVDVLHPIFETHRLHVDDVVGTKGLNVIHITCEGSGDNFGSGSLRELDRIGPDIAGSTMYKHRFRAVTCPWSKTICQAVLATTGTEAAST